MSFVRIVELTSFRNGTLLVDPSCSQAVRLSEERIRSPRSPRRNWTEQAPPRHPTTPGEREGERESAINAAREATRRCSSTHCCYNHCFLVCSLLFVLSNIDSLFVILSLSLCVSFLATLVCKSLVAFFGGGVLRCSSLLLLLSRKLVLSLFSLFIFVCPLPLHACLHLFLPEPTGLGHKFGKAVCPSFP